MGVLDIPVILPHRSFHDATMAPACIYSRLYGRMAFAYVNIINAASSPKFSYRETERWKG